MAKKRSVGKGRKSTRIPAEILKAYRATTYWIETPAGRIALRAGERSPKLDRLLSKHGADAWAFITAWNPRSEQLAADTNAQRQRGLESYAAEQGYVVIPGVGVPERGTWTPEKSCLVLGIKEAGARRLGASAGQYAILAGRKGAAARILSCVAASVSPDPRADFLEREAARRSPLAEQVERAIREETALGPDLEESLGEFVAMGAWLPIREKPLPFNRYKVHLIKDLVSAARLAELEDGASPNPSELSRWRQRAEEHAFDMTDSHDADEAAMYSLHRLLDENGDSYVALVLTYGGAMSGIRRSLVNIFASADEAMGYLRQRGRIDRE